MRIATYNVEWFNNLFNNAAELVDDDSWSGRWDVTKAQQIQALGTVFAAMDADAVMVIEAPDSNRRRDGLLALTHFAQRFGLRTDTALAGFRNDTQQEIALLYDSNVIEARHDPRESADAPAFDGAFGMDLDVDATPDLIGWSKPPLEVDFRYKNKALRLIGVHAKSKAPHGAQNDKEAIRISIENRRKQLAQCIWLRRRITQHLQTDDDLIVLGDFNDGPGLDEYEKLFGRSGVEVVLGEGDALQLFDPHAKMALGRRIGAQPATARFKRRGGPYLQALLDYIMVSPKLKNRQPDWQIWHPFDHPACYENAALREALLTASDHFPVVLDIDFGGSE